MGEPIFFKRRLLDKEYARELYDIGYCDQQIADSCGVGRECVSAWRRNNGLEGHKVLYKEKEKKRASTLNEMAAEAKAHGMSYGQYMAARRDGRLW